MNRQVLTRVARAYSLLELPAWGHLLRWSGAYDGDAWRHAGRESIRGKWHGYRMSLDLRNWSERQTYLETLRRDRPWIVAEVVHEHLERAVASEKQLFSQLLELGYEAFALHTARHGLKHRLRLVPIDQQCPQHGSDVLFMTPADPARTRLDAFIE